MRIAVGQLWQETNTLNPWPTRREDFEQFGVLRGPELVSQMAHTNELGGFIQSLAGWPERPEVVGLVRLPAWPAGPLTTETFDWLRDEILGALEEAGPLDGVLLALHGSMVADKHPDVEGEILGSSVIVTTDDEPELARQACIELADQLWQRREEYLPIDMGSSVVLRHDHVRIVVTSRSGPHFAPELFQAAGLDPFAAAVLVVKSPAGFRAAYASRALAIYSVQAPGCAPADFWSYPFANIPHPLWPWDELHHWSAQPVLVYHGEAR